MHFYISWSRAAGADCTTPASSPLPRATACLPACTCACYLPCLPACHGWQRPVLASKRRRACRIPDAQVDSLVAEVKGLEAKVAYCGELEGALRRAEMAKADAEQKLRRRVGNGGGRGREQGGSGRPSCGCGCWHVYVCACVCAYVFGWACGCGATGRRLRPWVVYQPPWQTVCMRAPNGACLPLPLPQGWPRERRGGAGGCRAAARAGGAAGQQLQGGGAGLVGSGRREREWLVCRLTAVHTCTYDVMRKALVRLPSFSPPPPL